MRSFFSWSFCLVLLISGFSVEAQKPVLKFNADKEFKVVQFTDLHLKYQDPASGIAFERVNQVLDIEKPDLVVLTGDIIYSKPAVENLQSILKVLSDRKQPFSIIFGNHDDEFEASREELFKVAEAYPYNLSEDKFPELSGVGNYILPVLTSDGKKEATVLYFFDSHAYNKIEGVGSYDYIKFDQIQWYLNESTAYTKKNGGVPFPALAFFHIPVPEYSYAYTKEDAQVYGIHRERVCSSKLNSGLFTALKQAGDVMGTFCGHDHDNDYAVLCENILLAYGRYTGGNTVYNDLPNGARIIVLHEGSRTFDTWIRTKEGVEQRVRYPESFTKKKEP